MLYLILYYNLGGIVLIYNYKRFGSFLESDSLGSYIAEILLCLFLINFFPVWLLLNVLVNIDNYVNRKKRISN